MSSTESQFTVSGNTRIDQTEENFGEDENLNLKDLNLGEADTENALDGLDDTAIDEEIDAISYPNNEFKSSDKKYKTTSIEGIVWYKDDISTCLKKRDEIILTLSDLFKNLDNEDIKQKHFLDNESFTHDYYIFFQNKDNWPVDHILVSCYDWSDKLEFRDHLRIAIVSKEYMAWLENLN